MYNNIFSAKRNSKWGTIALCLVYLGLFIGLGWPVPALSQDMEEDTVFQDSDTIHIPQISQFGVNGQGQQWLRKTQKVRNELDSLETKFRRQNHLAADTSDINRALAQLSYMGREISSMKVQTAKSREEARRFGTEQPGSGLDIQGAIADTSIVRQDSLRLVDSLLERLSADIGKLTADLRQIRGQSSQERVDTTLTSVDSIARISITKRLRHNMERDHSLRDYFDLDAWGGRILLILISVGYFYFLYRQGQKTPATDRESVPLYQNEPVWIPILKTVVFFGSFLPLFSFRIPVFVIQTVYFLLFIVLYVLLYQRYSEEKKWVIFVWGLVYVWLVAANLLLSIEIWSRILASIGNLAALFLVWNLLVRNKRKLPLHYMPRYVLWLLLGGFGLALTATVVGYTDVARVFSVASAVGFIQGLVLTASTKMITNDLKKYYEAAGEEKKIRRFDQAQLASSLSRVLAIANVVIVLSVLINTLGVAEQVLSGLERIFLKTRSIGGITYSYANLLFAIATLLAANWLQKTLNKIFNPVVNESDDLKRYALFPIFRLLIVVVGFLIAIGILGVGTTQLTVVIGALGVGAGLGLQNIINNFVSGIILIFEKPFKLGDYIELADKKGRVIQIGIRSSVLMSDQGGKVIIPNGDLLSGRIVNWTLYDAQIGFNIELSVGNDMEIKDIKDKLYAMLKADRFVEQAAPIHIFTKSIQADTYTVSLQTVLKHVRYMDSFRSAFLERIKKELDTKEVRITSL